MVSLRLNHKETESSAKKSTHWIINAAFRLFLLASLQFDSMKRHLFCSNKPNNVLFPFFLFNTVSLSAPQSTAHFICSILAGPQKEKNMHIHTCWSTEQLWFLIMRELSHRMSVCAAVWPGGRQNGQKQLLVIDFLWTWRRDLGFGSQQLLESGRAMEAAQLQSARERRDKW